MIPIYNKDLSEGSYIFTQPGYYQLQENITFHPNPDNQFQPREDQAEKYPRQKGYVLGFFAAFVFESDDVIFDLNKHTIECSKEFALKQRFFALIELASTPFIPKQGPANFGHHIIFVNNCGVYNGTLGLTPHHGIHGNGMKNIYMNNLCFRHYEVAGISLNGGEHIFIENCRLSGTSTNVPMLSTYSHAKFDLSFLETIVKKDPEAILEICNGQSKSVQKIYENVVNEIKAFENYVLKGTEYEGIFKNKSKLMDDNVYGISFNTLGVLVNDFKPFRNEESIGNNHIYLKNIIIENTLSNSTEIIGIFEKKEEDNPDTNSYGNKEFVGPAGDVCAFADCMDEKGCYKSNVISDMQMAICKFAETDKERGTANIADFLVKEWLPNNQMDLRKIIDEGNNYYWVYGRDSMSHVMKGNIGLFISQGLNVNVENCLIDGVYNLGKTPKKNSSQAIGLAIVGSENVSIKNTKIKNIRSLHGYHEKIKLINSNKNINIK
jgi:hypothetical protein